MNSEFHIRDVAKVTNGKSDVKDAMENGAFVFFDRSGSSKRSNRYLFDEEAAIIIPGEDSREVFEPRFCSGKFDLHQRCYVVYAFKDEISPKYLFYKLKTLTKHFANVFVGSTVPSLRLDHITDLKISAPSVDEQEKIAAVLSALDAKIELNNRINRELEAMAKTIYDYWFVQFEFPDANGRPYKTSGGKMIYNEQLKRHIPAGWGATSFGTICEIYQPKTISEKDMDADGKYFVFGANGIVGKYGRFNHEHSEIVITCRGATCGNIVRTYPKSWITGNAMVLRPKRECFSSEYIYHSVGLVNKRRMITGSAQPQITRQNVAPIETLMPSEPVLAKFNAFVEPTVRNRLVNLEENRQLAALRDWLLPMLMNGQVTVR